jgi:putative ABC transport system permease protein
MDLQVYTPLPDNSPLHTIVVRTNGSEATIVPRILDTIRRVAPSLKVYRIDPAESVIDGLLAGMRFVATLLTAVSVLAFLLTIVGLYGVMAYTVGQRTREIGLRMALGAQPGDVSRRVVIDGLFLAVVGAGVGLIGAVGPMRLYQSFLYGVKPSDPTTYVSVALALMVTTGLASYVPARRAARIDPAAALRDE